MSYKEVVSQFQFEISQILQNLTKIQIGNSNSQYQIIQNYGKILQQTKDKLYKVERHSVRKQIKQLRMVKFHNLLEAKKEEQRQILWRYISSLHFTVQITCCNLKFIRIKQNKNISAFDALQQLLHARCYRSTAYFKGTKAKNKEIQQNTLSQFKKQIEESENQQNLAKLNFSKFIDQGQNINSIQQIMLISLFELGKPRQIHFYLKGIYFVYQDHLLKTVKYSTCIEMYQLKVENTKILIIGQNNYSFTKNQFIEKSNIDTNTIKILSTFSFNNLQHFQITNNKIGNKGIYYLVKANWPRLKRLELNQGCQITNDALNYLIKANWPSLISLQMRTLDLQSNKRFSKIYFPINCKNGGLNYYGRRFKNRKIVYNIQKRQQ